MSAHRDDALELILSAEQWDHDDDHDRALRRWAAAQVHATLAVADELRTGNLIELLKILGDTTVETSADPLEWDEGPKVVATIRTRLGLDS